MIKIKLFAGTDVGLRDNNEDNFTVCPDLTSGEWMVPANQQEPILLGRRGCVMVVADGMGGMNAGEVASDIAVKTVEQMFSKMPADVTKNSDSIKAYLNKVIVSADLNVKKRCKEDPSTEGMGSTIVITWLINENAYIGWMGDSRAYSYIPGKGISRLSKDHSYVQELVDSKMLTEEKAMTHSLSNVITRSLGDTSEKARPDIICHPIIKGEIILMCSDGLCGVCTDATIANVINQESIDLKTCKEVLTTTALEMGGSDNITISLLQIVETDGQVNPSEDGSKSLGCLSWQNMLFCIFALGLLGILGVAGIKSCDMPKQPSIEESKVLIQDSLETDTAKSDIEGVGTNSDDGGRDNSHKITVEDTIAQAQELCERDSLSNNPTHSTDEGDSQKQQIIKNNKQ